MRRFFVGLAITAMLGIIPSQARGNDRQISQSIVKSLQAEQKNNKLSGFNIDLEVDEGAVYLKGTVVSAEQERLALDIARRIDGVSQVYNELEIVPTAASKADAPVELTPAPKVATVLSSMKKAVNVSARRQISADNVATTESTQPESTAVARDLAERIMARLKQEKATGHLQGFSLELEVDNGVAWLNGKVATPEQQNRVLDVVRNVQGVKQVVNGLAITQTKKTPTDIAQQVVSRLQEKKASGELKDFTVDVEVDHGIVWLSGQAANEAQRQLILDAARFVPGVVKVVNDLSVNGSNIRPTQQAAAKSQLVAAESPAETPRPPQPLPLEDEPIGSAVASGEASGRPAPVVQPPAAGASSGRPGVQYVWVPAKQMPGAASQMPLAFAPARAASHTNVTNMPEAGSPVPINASVPGMGIAPARFDHPQMPQYAWPSYAPYPNYGAVTYPKQYSPMAWPYIGPFYPYPQVPLGWRKVELKWKDGWWQLDFKDRY